VSLVARQCEGDHRGVVAQGRACGPSRHCRGTRYQRVVVAPLLRLGAVKWPTPSSKQASRERCPDRSGSVTEAGSQGLLFAPRSRVSVKSPMVCRTASLHHFNHVCRTQLLAERPICSPGFKR
jgi:hypothetical protein